MSVSQQHNEISKTAIRTAAMAFSKAHENDQSETAHKQLFWNDLLSIFGISVSRVGQFEAAAQRLSTSNIGWIDLLVPGRMAIEQKSKGGNLDKAMDQIFDYLDSVQEEAMPTLLIACNFDEFYWKNLETRTEGRFLLSDLSKNVEIFWWWPGTANSHLVSGDTKADLIATELLARVHDEVRATGYDEHALREWLTRILFCLFADDTQVWEPDAFGTYLYLHTHEDGTDLGSTLAHLFQILDTSDGDRSSNLDEDLRGFTYINGDIFANNLPIPSCNKAIRTALLDASKFDWSEISPAIFGSMFQDVMSGAERRHLGAHYTTEENILKTIHPLFLDELERELESIKVTTSSQSQTALREFQEKLANLQFFDPACGCGNFLVIAYREVRRLELEVIRKLAISIKQPAGQVMNVSELLKVNVGQFFGIEIEEFPARIARTALYLMDHKLNIEVSKEYGQYFARFPIPSSPHIQIGNALELDWNSLLPSVACDFILGNPPYIGSRVQDDDQKKDQANIWAGNKRQGTLDYVTNWFKLAAEYIDGTDIGVAFVTTNSITQGEQPAVLWEELWKHEVNIDFAHRTFSWSSEARGKAAVHVVIIGFSARPNMKQRELWFYPKSNGPGEMHLVSRINPYLLDAPNVMISSRQEPLVIGTTPMSFGSMPRDDGFLSKISSEEADEIRKTDPIAAKYLHRLIGAEELLNGGERYCLWLVDANPSDVSNSKVLGSRLAAVRDFRLKSKAASTRNFATTPGLFAQIAQPKTTYLAVPGHSSESRDYLPTAFYEPDVIASNALLFVPDASLAIFGIMSSRIFTAWNRNVSGRLESRLRVSQEITYNNFPWPKVEGDDIAKLDNAAKAVLAARAKFPDSTLAMLYDPIAMPLELVKAHEKLNKIVDGLYGSKTGFKTDEESLVVLFQKFEDLSRPNTFI